MSTVSRFISGSAASWVRIAVTIGAQIILVPLYITHWSVETYGLWLAIQALIGLLVTLDTGHQEFLGYEFLRIGTDDRSRLSRYLWSGVGIGLLINTIQLSVIVALLVFNGLPAVLGSELTSAAMTNVAGIVLLLQGLTWFICTSVSGLLFRVLSPFGYYPRMAWWNLGSTIVAAVAPAAAVVAGADLLMTGIVTAVATLLFSIPLYVDLIRLLRRVGIAFCVPSWQMGFANFSLALAVFGKIILENLRQQGVRLVLAPLSGATGLVAFSTMRTGANVALQGLNTVTGPLIPDLMRFLQKRDQVRTESAFGTVWIVVVALMAPAVVILQAFVEPFYLAWTRNQVLFDPWLFAVLSLSVLVFAVVQPASTVVIANNLLRPQLLVSLSAALIVVGGIYVLVPVLGILGAGLALLAGELLTTVCYAFVAQRWLRHSGLTWPKRSFLIVVTSVMIAGITMALMISLPNLKLVILLTSMVAFLGNAWRYWQVLPKLATNRAKTILGNLPGVGKLFPA